MHAPWVSFSMIKYSILSSCGSKVLGGSFLCQVVTGGEGDLKKEGYPPLEIY